MGRSTGVKRWVPYLPMTRSLAGSANAAVIPSLKSELRQWYLRITDYADRLLEGLETVDFSDAMKEMQTNWIGKSFGAEIDFVILPVPAGGQAAGLHYPTRYDFRR